MNLETIYFKKDYHYEIKLVNKYIAIIRFSKDEKKICSYKNLVFRMMKDIVKKNISNYLNLLRGTHRKNDLPSRNELVADCYIIFDKCLEKYKINKSYNFYFYYNKSLSRNFFRFYQKEIKRGSSVEMTEALMTANPKFHDNRELDILELLLINCKFSILEKKICHSRMIGQRTAEFLKENIDITNNQYLKSLKRIKIILISLKQEGEL